MAVFSRREFVGEFCGDRGLSWDHDHMPGREKLKERRLLRAAAIVMFVCVRSTERCLTAYAEKRESETFAVWSCSV